MAFVPVRSFKQLAHLISSHPLCLDWVTECRTLGHFQLRGSWSINILKRVFPLQNLSEILHCPGLTLQSVGIAFWNGAAFPKVILTISVLVCYCFLPSPREPTAQVSHHLFHSSLFSSLPRIEGHPAEHQIVSAEKKLKSKCFCWS